MWSKLKDNGNTPARLTLPYVAFMPTIPQDEAGLRTLPPVSVPIAMGSIPAATAAPDPDEEPPGWWLGFQGFRAGGHGKSNAGPPSANSWVESLPIRIAPAAFSLAATVASLCGILSASIFEWQVVLRPAVSTISLRPNGTP